MKNVYDKVKEFSESLVGDFAPWWVVPVGAVILLAIIL